MIKNLKLSALALMIAAAAMMTQAKTTNLLQSVSVAFTIYAQGTPVAISSGTKNVINHYAFATKDLIQALKATGTFNQGDILVRVTPIPGYLTNLVAVSTNILLLTNTSTSTLSVSNELILNGGAPVLIGYSNVVFGTNIAVIGGVPVTLETNFATVIDTNGTTTNGLTVEVGTNTTVTTSALFNTNGYLVGTNYVFVNNSLNLVSITNRPPESYWAIYNKNASPVLTLIPSTTLFDIRTDRLHGDGTNLAYLNGETFNKNGREQGGTTEEVRTLVFSNSTWNIRLNGDASASAVVNLEVNSTLASLVYSPDYSWTAGGSGTTTNSAPVIVKGTIREWYYSVLRQ